MNLVIFDIDGTLVNSYQADHDCFIQAICAEFDIHGINPDWSKYKYSTDSGLAYEILSIHLGRAPIEEEFARLRSRFMGLLAETRVNKPETFAEVNGATEALQMLGEEEDWRTAIATGCWLESAYMKLGAVNVKYDGLPLNCADDSFDRKVIVKRSIEAAGKVYKKKSFRKTVYIGDGIWDVRTAKVLGLDFVGIGAGERAEDLMNEGAQCVIPDYSDYDRFIKALNESKPPV